MDEDWDLSIKYVQAWLRESSIIVVGTHIQDSRAFQKIDSLHHRLPAVQFSPRAEWREHDIEIQFSQIQ